MAKLRERIPGVTLRTTFIVGFPGETEDDFAQLLEFVAESRFDRVGIFRYSDEEGTAALALDGKVPRAVARERYRRLAKLQAGIQAEKLGARVGSEAERAGGRRDRRRPRARPAREPGARDRRRGVPARPGPARRASSCPRASPA